MSTKPDLTELVTDARAAAQGHAMLKHPHTAALLNALADALDERQQLDDLAAGVGTMLQDLKRAGHIK